MNSSANSLRAQAYHQKSEPIGITPYGILRGVLRGIARLFHRPIECRHERNSLPYNDRQHCLECGASRRYKYTQTGISTGPWEVPLPPLSTALPVDVDRPIPAYLKHIPARKAHVIQTHCKDCEELLDAFGMCPNARSRDGAIMAAPVNCGKPHLSTVPRILATTNEVMDRHNVKAVR
ncbi:MAG TPA: hypothetical protein VFB43_00965 [Terracidiphilus sp.]|nr:hypothetical protein [Terracidiphilus sp.]